MLKGKIKILTGTEDEKDVKVVQYESLEEAGSELGEEDALKRINRTILTDTGNKARAAVRRGGEVKEGGGKKSAFVVD